MLLFRLLFIIAFIFINLSNAINVLDKVSLRDNILELKFKSNLNPKDIRYITLNDPKREVIDFEHSILGSNIGTINSGGIVRIGQNRPDKVRVVISGDIDGKIKLSENIYQIPLKIENNVASCFVDEVKKDDKSTKNDIKYISQIEKIDKTIKDEKNSQSDSSSKTKEQGFWLTKIKDNNLISIEKEIIVIDAGHGGKDPGAIYDNRKEKDITLAVAKKLGRILTNRGYEVYLTRDDDRFITLEQRTKMADKKDAKIFISLHCNAAPNDRVANNMYGVESFFLEKSKDARSKAIAARENASVLQGTDNNSKEVIVDAVLCGPKIVLSNKLAIDIQKNIIKNISTKDGGVRSAPFWVLLGASRPSVLVEMGYITHPEEGEMLLNDGYQEKIADGIANGIDNYFENQKKEIGY